MVKINPYQSPALDLLQVMGCDLVCTSPGATVESLGSEDDSTTWGDLY